MDMQDDSTMGAVQEVEVQEEVLAYEQDDDDDIESTTIEGGNMDHSVEEDDEFPGQVEGVVETVVHDDSIDDEDDNHQNNDVVEDEVDGDGTADDQEDDDIDEREHNSIDSGEEEQVSGGEEEQVSGGDEPAYGDEEPASGGEEPDEKDVSNEADKSVNYSISSGENEVSKPPDVDFDDDVEVEEEKNEEDLDQNDQNVNYHETEGEEAGDDEKLNKSVLNLSDENASDSEKVAGNETVNTPEKTDPAQPGEGEEVEEGIAKDIADIFGESDDDNDDEEFTGFDEGDEKRKRKIVSDSEDDDGVLPQADDDGEQSEQKQQQVESSDDEGVVDDQQHSGSFVYDFDLIMQQKKAENKSRRRRDGGTTISDVDDIVNNMLMEMKAAADEDREALKNKKPALNKLKMLKRVVSHINKQDMKESFIEMGVYSAIADWLTPIQDYNLPHLSIRRELLKILHSLPSASAETLTSSKVGRAVMLIFKHPKEIRANKESAGRLINKWSRPLFGLNENFKSMSRSEREERDLKHMPPSKKRKTSDVEPGTSSSVDPGAAASGESETPLRPGDKGFVMRARVPMPSNKDYVIRPKWKVGQEGGEDGEGMGASFRRKSKAKKDSRLDKHIKNFAEKKKRRKMQRAAQISIEGNKMKLV